jgi:type IV pilus assembly protein PilC
MVSAGISLPRSLNLLSEQAKTKRFKSMLSEASQEISRGKSFSETLAAYPNIFSEIFVSMIKVGEEAGTLEEVLKILTSQMEKEYELKSKIKGAMIYPSVIFAAMIIIGTMMLILVVPKLAETFKDLNVELPPTTRAVIWAGNFAANFWYLALAFPVVLFFLIKLFLKTKKGKQIFDKLVLKIPILGPITKKTYTAYTVRTLGSLINSGVPIIRSLDITAGVLKNVYYKAVIAKASEHVRKGGKLSVLITQHPKIYSILVSQMIAVGEETGQTGEMLVKLANFYEEEVANSTKNLSTVIEPILMLIVGAVVGFFAVSMLQPIYGMVQSFSG